MNDHYGEEKVEENGTANRENMDDEELRELFQKYQDNRTRAQPKEKKVLKISYVPKNLAGGGGGSSSDNQLVDYILPPSFNGKGEIVTKRKEMYVGGKNVMQRKLEENKNATVNVSYTVTTVKQSRRSPTKRRPPTRPAPRNQPIVPSEAAPKAVTFVDGAPGLPKQPPPSTNANASTASAGTPGSAASPKHGQGTATLSESTPTPSATPTEERRGSGSQPVRPASRFLAAGTAVIASRRIEKGSAAATISTPAYKPRLAWEDDEEVLELTPGPAGHAAAAAANSLQNYHTNSRVSYSARQQSRSATFIAPGESQSPVIAPSCQDREANCSLHITPRARDKFTDKGLLSARTRYRPSAGACPQDGAARVLRTRPQSAPSRRPPPPLEHVNIHHPAVSQLNTAGGRPTVTRLALGDNPALRGPQSQRAQTTRTGRKHFTSMLFPYANAPPTD